MKRVLLSALLVGIAPIVQASPARDQRQPHTAAAVVAADEAWGRAEVNGDVAFVDALLLPSYRSIGSDGHTTSKEAILQGIRRRGGHSDDLARQVAAWKAAHPTRSSVAIEGDTAILTWLVDRDGSAPTVSSCDVFAYRDGRWRAAYSQHSSASL